MAANPKAQKAAKSVPSDGLRQSIIEAARRSFAEESYAGLTMRKIAARVGCTAGAIYLYFPGKEDLLRHVWEDEFANLHVYMRGAVDQTRDPIEKVRQIFLAWVRYFLQHAEDFRIMFVWQGPGVERDRVDPASSFGRSTESYQYFRTMLSEVIRDAPAAPRDLDMAMQSLLTATFGVVAMANGPSQFPWFDPEEVAETIVDSILRGWGVEVRRVA
ncbi:TetR/AcrR family transcriptional regulator [Sphingoaurantiacus capsulatus]|uniref:TetR/AcrR family transcriptional regulator n=1 Tax=Sphingoaurantiacus capsulatus TaxID=1771310 RepID=A0ABV7X9Z5_9SPHN